MAENIIILGAGASRYLGAPLMHEFIDAAADLRRAGGNITMEDFDRIFELLQNRFMKLHAKAVLDQQNIESVFSLIEMGALIETLPDTRAKEIPVFQHSIRRVLAETIERRMQYTWDADGLRPPEHHQALLGRVFGDEQLGQYDEDASRWGFITFNYDLALDLALHWNNYVIDYGLDDQKKSGAIPLLKLHGSINWARCSKCNAVLPVGFDKISESRPRLPRVTMGASQVEVKQPVRAPLRVLHLLGARCKGHCAGAEPNNEPALVPPSWNKTQVHWEFERLWRRAARELGEAERIWIVGYSVPPSDAFFHDFLALSLAAPTRLRLIRTVNIDPEVGQRVKVRLGPLAAPRFHHIQSDFESFAAASFPRKLIDAG